MIKKSLKTSFLVIIFYKNITFHIKTVAAVDQFDNVIKAYT